MTLSSAVDAAWLEHVFSHEDITAITSKVLNYELFEHSEFELGEVSYSQEINFFEYLITRSVSYPRIGGALFPEYTFLVEVRYTREADTDGAAYEAARAARDTLQATIAASLGETWQGTVHFWTPQPVQPITRRQVANTPCWSWVNRYAGTFR